MLKIEQLLIVAAGQGTRLQAHGPSKPLVRVGGKPLIEHAITSAVMAGVQRVVVVTGYCADELTAYLSGLGHRRGWRIDTVYNPLYQRSNGLSVLAAEPLLSGCFFLTMCDHLVDSAIYLRLIQARLRQGSVALGVDRRLDNPMVDLDDVTRVLTNGPDIAEIGKNLNHYNAFDTGVFRADAGLFQMLRTSQQTTGDESISGAMRCLARAGQARAVDIGEAFWIDVDSPAMLRLAEQQLSGLPQLREQFQVRAG